MGGILSSQTFHVATEKEREDIALGPPTKIMDASEKAQGLVKLLQNDVQAELGLIFKTLDHLKATQMITRDVAEGKRGTGGGTMYYIKVKTGLEEWPWIFVKIYEPSLVTDVSKITLKALKKMKEEYNLVTF